MRRGLTRHRLSRRRHMQPAGKPCTLQHLHRDAAREQKLSLAAVLARLGRVEASSALYRRLAQIEPHPPFHFFHLGQAAFQRNDFHAARELFAKEVARADYYHEFHFWLGLAHFKLGEIEQARRQLTIALENSTTRNDRDLYGAKLAWLRARSDP